MVNFKGKVSVRPSDLKGGRLIQEGAANILQKPAEVFESHLVYTAAKAGDDGTQARLEEMQRQLVLAPEDLGQIVAAPEFTGFSQVVLGLSTNSETVKSILNMLFNGQYSVKDGLLVGITPRDEAHLIKFLGKLTGWQVDFINVPDAFWRVDMDLDPYERKVQRGFVQGRFIKNVQPGLDQLLAPLGDRDFTEISFHTNAGKGLAYGFYSFSEGPSTRDSLGEGYPLKPVSEGRPVVFGIKR